MSRDFQVLTEGQLLGLAKRYPRTWGKIVPGCLDAAEKLRAEGREPSIQRVGRALRVVTKPTGPSVFDDIEVVEP